MAPSQRVYKTEAVILRRRNLGEADSIFTVFSPEEGKFDAIARGVRKPRSRMRGHLEPLTRSRVMLARGRTLDVFTQAETVDAYLAMRENMEAVALALYCAELVDRFTADRHPQPELYELFLRVLEAIEAGYLAVAVRWFEVQLLAQTGYGIHVDGCVLCGGRLEVEETLLSAAAGGLVCRGCRPRAEGGRILSIRAVKVLRFARDSDVGAFCALRNDGDLAAELKGGIGDVVRYVLEREPATGRHVDEVERLSRTAT